MKDCLFENNNLDNYPRWDFLKELPKEIEREKEKRRKEEEDARKNKARKAWARARNALQLSESSRSDIRKTKDLHPLWNKILNVIYF